MAYTTDGYAYGGYASASWQNAQNYTIDNNSFLFRLKANNNNSYVHIESTNAHIYDHSSYGPAFGSPNQGLELSLFKNMLMKPMVHIN